MSVSALGYLVFEVRDVEAWSAFATDLLGMMPADRADDALRFRLDDHAWRFEIRKGEADDLASAGFEVAGADELGEMARRLRDGGVDVVDGDADLAKSRGVRELVTCKDPDGLGIEIYYGRMLRTERPFVSPAGVSGFLTDPQGLGHMVLATGDIEKTRAFYKDLLGFRLSDYIQMRMGPDFAMELEFYHCNARHHTLALAPLPMPPPKRLHHFMLQTRTIDDVGFALDRAYRSGAPITSSLGRHSNDRMISFYVQTPSGFEVEFGFGALEVDDATWRITRHDKPSSWGHRPPGKERS